MITRALLGLIHRVEVPRNQREEDRGVAGAFVEHLQEAAYVERSSDVASSINIAGLTIATATVFAGVMIAGVIADAAAALKNIDSTIQEQARKADLADRAPDDHAVAARDALRETLMAETTFEETGRGTRATFGRFSAEGASRRDAFSGLIATIEAAS